MSQLERFNPQQKLLTPTHEKWVRTYGQKGTQYPITLEIDPTNKCPLNCEYCIWADFREDNKASLKPGTLSRVVKEAADIGIRSIHWTGGGEPLAHPETLDSIKLARGLGIRNGMFTTAIPMTPQASEVLLKNVDWIRVHVDGATTESYGKVHRVNGKVLNKVQENLAYFTELRRKTGSKTSIGIGTVALEANIGEVAQLAKMAHDLGLDFFQYKHDLTQMTDERYLTWWNTDVIPVLDRLSEELEGSSFKLQYSKGVNYTSPDLSQKCHVRFMSTALTAEGNVAYCKSTRDKLDWTLGNVYTQSLKEIFDSEKSRQLISLVTPTTCGILPCPYKSTNIMLTDMVERQDFSALGTVSPIQHQDFI